MKKRLAYLCLQATREGQASYAHVHEIIKGLKSRGWDIKLFEPFYAMSHEPVSSFRRLIEFFRVQITLLRQIWRQRVDALYIRWHFASYPTALWVRWRGIKVVQEVNGPYEDLFIAWPLTRRLSSLFIFLMRSQLRMADTVIAVTPQLASWAKKEAGHSKVYVVPNGANTESFHPDAELDLALNIPYPYVIFFGALAPWQGIDTMLKALDHPDWPEPVRLVVVGDGVERARIEKIASQTNRLVYLGVQPYSRMPGIIAHAIAGLIPKNSKGQRASTGLSPLKMYETLACGVPVIVTDFPGQADLVRSVNCGIIIPPNDSQALAKAVNYIYYNSEESRGMGKRGRVVVEKEHSWDKRAAETGNIIVGTMDNGVLDDGTVY